VTLTRGLTQVQTVARALQALDPSCD